MFTVELPVKPYVKQYITLNFGNPADFSTDKLLIERFRKFLIKPSIRYNSVYNNDAGKFHTQQVRIKISEDDFYRYGWELSPSDIIAFGKTMERQAKFLMRNMVSFYMTFMIERDAVLTFQKNFGFTEDIWPFESIKKDFYRSIHPSRKISFTHDLSKKIEEIILVNLSGFGTLSPKALKTYETLKKID
ncbi:MAG: hypothetical protein ACOYOA_16820 [Saprospiraceae bacterium]